MGRKKVDNEEENQINYNTDQRPTKKQKRNSLIIMLIWLLIFVLICFSIYKLAMYTIGKSDKDSVPLYNAISSIVSLVHDRGPATTEEKHVVKFAGVGDIYATSNTLRGSKVSNTYDFTTGTESIQEKLKEFDFVVGSLNTPVAGSELGYSTTKTYNTPVEILDTIQKLNISALATATSHSMDKKQEGVLNTIENIETKGIKYTGTNKSQEKSYLILEKNNIKIGVLSYTTESNIKMSDDETYLVNVLTDESLTQDVKYLKDQNVDFIVAYLCCPNEDSTLTNNVQKENADKLFDAGVNIVLGTGSKVVQGYYEDQIEISGSEEKSHVYAIYSLGDLIGSYETDDNLVSVIANIEFEKDIVKNRKGEVIKETKDFKVNLPISTFAKVTSSYSSTLYLLDDAMEKYNTDSDEFTAGEYEIISDASERIKKLFE